MKNIKYLLVLIIAAILFSGCDKLWNTDNHYVTFKNTDPSKFITTIYYKEPGETKWSKDQVSSDIYPGDNITLVLYQGTYDFEIVMEDEEYSYTFYNDNIVLNDDVTLEICYDCYRDSNIKIERHLKENRK
ncbi:MAG: hypothetical protein PHN88_01650 [Ignavibacteria bacterium]|nr:hypothetical protein [Ignavibacteria bacterium]